MCDSDKIRAGGSDYVSWVKSQLSKLTKYGAVAFGGNVYPQMGKLSGIDHMFFEGSCFDQIREKIHSEFNSMARDGISFGAIDIRLIEGYSLLSANLAFRGAVEEGVESIGYVWTLVKGEPNEQFVDLFQLYCERISASVFREKSLVAISALSQPVLYSEEDLKEVVEVGVIEITEALAASDCIVWRADEAEKMLVSFVDSGGFLENESIEIPFGKGIAGMCHSQGKSLNIERLQSSDYLKENLGISESYNGKMVKDNDWQSALFSPLKNEVETFGVASVYSRREYGFSNFELTIFEAFAQRMTVAMAHALQVRKWNRVNAKIEKDAPIYTVGVEAMRVAHDAVNKIGDAQDALNYVLTNYKMDKKSNIYKNIVACSGYLALSLLQLKRLTKAARMQKKELKSENRKVKKFLSSLLKNYIDDPENRNITIELVGKQDIGFRIDEVQLSAALANLIENSIFFVKSEHSRSGGIIRVTYKLAGGKVIIEVFDNGPGIRNEWKPRIFDFFFTRKGNRGLGLGLGIAKNIIERHGGDISIQGEWGEWIKFVISVPLDNRGKGEYEKNNMDR